MDMVTGWWCSKAIIMNLRVFGFIEYTVVHPVTNYLWCPQSDLKFCSLREYPEDYPDVSHFLVWFYWITGARGGSV